MRFVVILIVGICGLLSGCFREETSPTDPTLQKAIEHFQELGAIFDYGKESGVEQLILENNQEVTNDDMKFVNQLPRLQHLNLYNTPIDDEGLSQLNSFPNLTVMNLGKTKISDESVEQLASFESLQYLFIDDTNISPEGTQRLEEALPNSRVYDGRGLPKE